MKHGMMSFQRNHNTRKATKTACRFTVTGKLGIGCYTQAAAHHNLYHHEMLLWDCKKNNAEGTLVAQF